MGIIRNKYVLFASIHGFWYTYIFQRIAYFCCPFVLPEDDVRNSSLPLIPLFCNNIEESRTEIWYNKNVFTVGQCFNEQAYIDFLISLLDFPFDFLIN